MTHPALIERITRSLAYMLRHQPEEFDLEVDDHGYAEMGEVIRALNERLGEAVTEDDVREAVESGDRQRYELVGDRIRALYGHSIEVQPGEPSRPPDRLYVGVSRADADRARRYGLRPGRRRFLHLALTPEDALETAQRTAREHEVIVVRALDAWEEGINFYDRISLFLSDPIPTQFLEGAVPDGRRAPPARESRGEGHRGLAPARPAPVRHAREEVVYARPDDEEPVHEHEEIEPEDAAAEFAPGPDVQVPAAGDDAGRRRRRGRRGRGRREGGPADAALPPAGVDDTRRAAPRGHDYEEAPRARDDYPREAPPARPDVRREERAPRGGAPGGGYGGAPAGAPPGGRGGDAGRPWDRGREERPERREPERAFPSDRGAPRFEDRGPERPREERPRAPERAYDDRPRGPERAREERPRDDRPRADDRPRPDDRPRYEERPREERPRMDERPRDDRPRPEDRPRFEERPREDRGEGRPQGRPERGGRPPEAPRPPARRDEIPRPAYDAPRRPEPESGFGGGFGGGLEDGGSGRPAPQRPAPPPRPAPRAEERAPERKPERPAPADDGGFGAGIL